MTEPLQLHVMPHCQYPLRHCLEVLKAAAQDHQTTHRKQCSHGLCSSLAGRMMIYDHHFGLEMPLSVQVAPVWLLYFM